MRIGYLFVSAALAGACGGLLAYGIGFMDGVAGQRGWRWILILEGLPTFILGIVTWFFLADDPESAYYLSKVSPSFLVSCSLSRQAYVSSLRSHRLSNTYSLIFTFSLVSPPFIVCLFLAKDVTS